MDISPYIIEIITGVAIILGTIVGVVVAFLNKQGLIHFGRLKLNKEHSKEDYSILIQKQCPSHDEISRFMTSLKAEMKNMPKLIDKIEAMHDQQIKNVALHEQHMSRFATGDIDIKKIQADIKQLCIGIALLLERTGGRPKSFMIDSGAL